MATPFLRRVLFFAIFTGFVAATVSAGERFAVTHRQSDLAATWLTRHGDRFAVGSDRSLQVADAGPAPIVRWSRSVPDPVSSAALLGDRLYLGHADGALRVVEVGSPATKPRRIRLSPEPRGSLRLAHMDDHLLVAEDGFGIRILAIPFHAGHEGHAGNREETLVSVIPSASIRSEGPFTAIASSARRIYVGRSDGRLTVIDAVDPTSPYVVRELDTGITIRALAANGDLVYVLDAERLVLLDLATGEPRTVAEQSIAGGSAMSLTGRVLHVVGPSLGLVTLRDESILAETFNMSVGDNFFSIPSLDVNVGDTVVWNKNTVGFHNVESCDGVSDPAFCSGVVAADGLWLSGSPTGSTFTFQHTFQNPGPNPYFCRVHTGFGMNGLVQVNDAPPTAPPGVPDGQGGSPVTVSASDAAKSLLTVSWDAATCTGQGDHHIIFGGGSQLPTQLGGTYALSGSRCDIGTTSPVVWDSPATSIDPGGLVWWLVVADDDGQVEGSWGRAGGTERNGSGAGGSSGQCGITSKDLTNVCGQ